MEFHSAARCSSSVALALCSVTYRPQYLCPFRVTHCPEADMRIDDRRTIADLGNALDKGHGVRGIQVIDTQTQNDVVRPRQRSAQIANIVQDQLKIIQSWGMSLAN